MQEFNISKARIAKIQNKDEFILEQVAGKRVLDLGCVDGDLEIYQAKNSQWLHGKIVSTGKSVLGIDICEDGVLYLCDKGYNMQVADATLFQSQEKFQVIVCGDLIEHISNPGDLFSRCVENLEDEGKLIVCTPHPFAATRFLNLLFDKSTPVHFEHSMWFDPQTLAQLAARYGLEVEKFSWLSTDYPCPTRRRFWGRAANVVSRWLAARRHDFSTDFGMVFCKSRACVKQNFSVIIPTYNRSDMAIDVISDMLNQDYSQEYEIIVVDNGSDCGHVHAIKKYLMNLDSQVPIRFIREKRRGLVYSRHTGAAFAKYKYLFFCDDDGRYDKNCLRALADVYENSGATVAVGTKIVIAWDEIPTRLAQKNEFLLGALDYGKTFSSQCFYINGGSFSIKKDSLYRVGGFNVDQVGSILLGNGETGLCEKLWQTFASIGFTTKTVMRHRQSISANAALPDLRRRYWNWGVSESYTVFVAPCFPGVRREKIYFYALSWLPVVARMLFGAIRHRDLDRVKSAYLLVFGRIAGFWNYAYRLVFDKKLKKFLAQNDCQLSDNYNVDDAEMILTKSAKS